MNKKTQMYLGLGLLAVAGYYFWNKSKTSSPKANVAGKLKVRKSNRRLEKKFEQADPYNSYPSSY